MAFAHVAGVGKALSSPKRLELVDLLCQGPRTVEALAAETAMSVANASRHLQVLRAARLVQSEKHGLYVTYRLTDERVGDVFVALRALATTRIAEIEQVTRAFFDEFEALDERELLKRVRANAVTLLDVRPPEEFRAGHIPGALSFPIDELEARVREIPRGKDVVAYCRGPYCVFAARAVDVLRRRGLRAFRMGYGVADWRARGWRVERGSAAA